MNWPAPGTTGRSYNIRPAIPHRIGRSRRIDHDHDVSDWDYAAELFPPGALESVPPPTTLVWAHRLDASPPDPTPELTLCFGVEHYFRVRQARDERTKKKGRPRRLAYGARYRERRRQERAWWGR